MQINVNENLQISSNVSHATFPCATAEQLQLNVSVGISALPNFRQNSEGGSSSVNAPKQHYQARQIDRRTHSAN